MVLKPIIAVSTLKRWEWFARSMFFVWQFMGGIPSSTKVITSLARIHYFLPKVGWSLFWYKCIYCIAVLFVLFPSFKETCSYVLLSGSTDRHHWPPHSVETQRTGRIEQLSICAQLQRQNFHGEAGRHTKLRAGHCRVCTVCRLCHVVLWGFLPLWQLVVFVFGVSKSYFVVSVRRTLSVPFPRFRSVIQSPFFPFSWLVVHNLVYPIVAESPSSCMALLVVSHISWISRFTQVAQICHHLSPFA